MLTFSKLSAQQISDTDWSTQEICKLLPNLDFSAVDNNQTWFAAWLDGQVIGIASLDGKLSAAQPTSGILCDLFVSPNVRRQGVGRMLVGLVAGAVMEMGAYFLRTQQVDTPEATAFSAKIGFNADTSASGTLLLDLTDTKGLRQH